MQYIQAVTLKTLLFPDCETEHNDCYICKQLLSGMAYNVMTVVTDAIYSETYEKKTQP